MRKLVQIQESLEKEFPNVRFTEEQLAKIEQYLNFLSQWNKKINLTAIRDENQMFVKHILDSLAIFKLSEEARSSIEKSGKILDMGSGGGLPSIILSIVNPELSITSVDKVQKKIGFQDFVRTNLGLKNFHPVAGNLNALGKHPDHRKRYDCIVTRAFDQIAGIFQFTEQFLKPDGSIILWKGKRWRDEWEESPEEMRRLYEVTEIVPYQFEQYEWGGTMLSIKRG